MLEGNSVWPENPLFHCVPQKLLEDTTFTKEARNALVMVVPASLGCSVETVLWQLALMAVLLLSSISLTVKQRGESQWRLITISHKTEVIPSVRSKIKVTVYIDPQALRQMDQVVKLFLTVR